MNCQPTLHSERLVLRPMDLADAPRVQLLAGHPEVAATTVMIPHPYPDGAAEAWIATHEEAWRDGIEATFAVALKADELLVGAMALRTPQAEEGEMGYWIAVDHWGRGYATEALCRLTRFALEELGMRRVYAHHLAFNPASGRVLVKAGFRHCGSGVQEEGIRFVGEPVEQYEFLRTDLTE
jgi:ribosomal-protein-alanine N-acetyltransferase